MSHDTQSDSPFFYIMLPTLNRPDLVIRAVNSVITQEYRNFQLIIFNDGSTESYIRLENLIKDNPNIKYIKSKNIGINKSRNIMIKEMSKNKNIENSYFFTLSDDDYLIKDCLKSISDEIKANPQIWYCFNCISNSQHILSNTDYNEYCQIAYKKFKTNYKGDKHFVFKLKETKNIRYPEEHFKNGYEHIYYVQIPSKIQTVPISVKVIEYHEDGLTLSDLYDNQETLKILIKQIKSAPHEIMFYIATLKYILSPKNLIKEIISEKNYYKIKVRLGLKGKKLVRK